MTRFWLTLEQGVWFVIGCIERMRGGEVFVPKIPSMNIMDLAAAVAPGCEVREVGIRPGEKLHEVLLFEDEARHAMELDDMFVIQPSHPWWRDGDGHVGERLPDGFEYRSDNNDRWLTVDDLATIVGEERSPTTP